MTAETLRAMMDGTPASQFELYERRPGQMQLIAPLLHEDGDMLDIYLCDSPFGDNFVRICDFGMTLMRLSYTFDVETPARRAILSSIMINNRIEDDSGNLYLDTASDKIYEGILQYSAAVHKICSMDYWNREMVRTAFYDDLSEFVTTELERFAPVADSSPLTEYPFLSVDWSLTRGKQNLYLFGVLNNDKAKSVAIALLEMQKAGLPYLGIVVHENIAAIGSREQQYLTNNADKQYTSLSEFSDRAVADINRLTAAL